jgi:hypothetical protein
MLVAILAVVVSASPVHLDAQTTRVRLLAQLTPPPPPPAGPEAPPPALQQAAPPQLADRFAGSLSATEVVAGTLTYLGVGVVGFAASLGGLVLMFAGRGAGLIGVALFVVGVVSLIAAPLIVAMAVNVISEGPYRAGSLTKSIGLAYLTFAALWAFTFLMLAALPSAAVGVVEAVLLAVNLVAVPIAASFGLHWGPATAPEPILAERLAPAYAAFSASF